MNHKRNPIWGATDQELREGTYYGLADKYGCCPETVKVVRRERGIELPPNRRGRKLGGHNGPRPGASAREMVPRLCLKCDRSFVAPDRFTRSCPMCTHARNMTTMQIHGNYEHAIYSNGPGLSDEVWFKRSFQTKAPETT